MCLLFPSTVLIKHLDSFLWMKLRRQLTNIPSPTSSYLLKPGIWHKTVQDYKKKCLSEKLAMLQSYPFSFLLLCLCLQLTGIPVAGVQGESVHHYGIPWCTIFWLPNLWCNFELMLRTAWEFVRLNSGLLFQLQCKWLWRKILKSSLCPYVPAPLYTHHISIVGPEPWCSMPVSFHVSIFSSFYLASWCPAFVTVPWLIFIQTYSLPLILHKWPGLIGCNPHLGLVTRVSSTRIPQGCVFHLLSSTLHSPSIQVQILTSITKVLWNTLKVTITEWLVAFLGKIAARMLKNNYLTLCSLPINTENQTVPLSFLLPQILLLLF